MTIEYVRYFLCTPILFSRSSSIRVSLAGFQSTGKLFGMRPFEPLARALPDMSTFCSAKYRSVQMRPFVLMWQLALPTVIEVIEIVSIIV